MLKRACVCLFVVFVIALPRSTAAEPIAYTIGWSLHHLDSFGTDWLGLDGADLELQIGATGQNDYESSWFLTPYTVSIRGSQGLDGTYAGDFGDIPQLFVTPGPRVDWIGLYVDFGNASSMDIGSFGAVVPTAILDHDARNRPLPFAFTAPEAIWNNGADGYALNRVTHDTAGYTTSGMHGYAQQVPEPASLLLFGVGAIGFIWRHRRRAQKLSL